VPRLIFNAKTLKLCSKIKFVPKPNKPRRLDRLSNVLSVPIPGTTVSALRRRALANWCCRSICWPVSCRQQQFRLLVSLAANHDGPGHPSNLVGERHGRHFRGSVLHQSAESGPLLRSVLACVADEGHCANHQSPPQISIALLSNERPNQLLTERSRIHCYGTLIVIIFALNGLLDVTRRTNLQAVWPGS
jgi:hypothetical protein